MNLFTKFMENLDEKLAAFQAKSGFAPDFHLYPSWEMNVTPDDKSNFWGCVPHYWGYFNITLFNFSFEEVCTCKCAIENDGTFKPMSSPYSMPSSLAAEFPKFITEFLQSLG